jgi:hypothetical protein
MLKFFMKKEDYAVRNIGKMVSMNDGNRSLNESIMSIEVIEALEDWYLYNNSDCILIGGIALSFYIKPRFTQDVDVLFLSDTDIPDSVEKFKAHRKGAFQHNKTHVEIEVITPESINTTKDTVEAVFNTANLVDGVKIASPSGLVALKLGRFSLQDRADIYELYKYGPIDLTPFHLSDILIKRFYDLIKSEEEIL